MLKIITFNAVFSLEKDRFKFRSRAFFVFFFFQLVFLQGQLQTANREGVAWPQKEECAGQNKDNSKQLAFTDYSAIHIVGEVEIFTGEGAFLHVKNNKIKPSLHSPKKRKAEKKSLVPLKKEKEKIVFPYTAKKKRYLFQNTGSSEKIELHSKIGSRGIDTSRIYFLYRDKAPYNHLFKFYIKKNILFSSTNSKYLPYSRIFRVRPPPAGAS